MWLLDPASSLVDYSQSLRQSRSITCLQAREGVEERTWIMVFDEGVMHLLKSVRVCMVGMVWLSAALFQGLRDLLFLWTSRACCNSFGGTGTTFCGF